MKHNSLIVIIMLLLIFLSPLTVPAALSTEPADVVLKVGDQPGGVWNGVPARSTLKQPDPLWSLRTGFPKGIADQSFEQEIFSGPDAAILRSGSYAEWTGLLADLRESAVLVGPDDLAGLAATKPLLIIPSGGLTGLSSSNFFRAGLMEYARSGGIVLCFTQRKGSDLAGLPVPDSSKTGVMGVGWSEDSGSLYRSSQVQDTHAVLDELPSTTPSIETDGYLTAYPPNAAVLLARKDGYPTFILYGVGKGWVAVTTLMSDVSYAQGLLADDERALVRAMVLWAKSGGKAVRTKAGKFLSMNLAIRGPGEGESASVKVMVMGPSREKPRYEQTVMLHLKASQEETLPFTYGIPVDTPAGIYHIEYLLLDGKKKQLTSPIESGESWFEVVPQSPPPPRIAKAAQPLIASPVRFTAVPSFEHRGDRARVELDITKIAGPAGAHDLIARIAGQESVVRISKERGSASAELPWGKAGDRVSYALYHASGRSLARGSIPVGPPKASGVSVDRPWYLPGQKIRVSAAGMGAGEISITGLGSVQRGLTSKNSSFELTVPAALPAGLYPITWEFQTTAGIRQEGEVSVAVQGGRVVCNNASFMAQPLRSSPSITASFRFTSSQAQRSVLQVQPVSPEGKVLPGRELAVSLVPGDNDIDLSVPFKADWAGIWTFRYTLSARLPEGPGFSQEPVVLLAGRVLHDAGVAAVLAMNTDKPMYYEASGPVTFTAVVYGTGPSKFELFLDGKRIRKEKVTAAGVTSFTAPLSGIALGYHVLRATASGDDREASREFRFIYGARLPDLTTVIRTSDPTAPIMEIVVGVMNQGKVASGHANASLYEGDPAKGGELLQKELVPPLAPGKQHVFLVKWPLARKAGPHSFTAVVDQENKIVESSKNNNAATVSLTVPELLLTLKPEKTAYIADEPVRYTVGLANFADRTFKKLDLKLLTTDPSGKTVSSETIALTDFATGAERTIARSLDLPVLQEGTYLIAAQVVADRPIESNSMGITILPTLLLKGSLEGTPSTAALCMPFTMKYTVKNGGNVQPTNGALKLELRSTDRKQLVYAQQLPFALDARTNRIENVDFPRGVYTLSLRASAVNQQQGLTSDFLLAEQPVTVAGPVDLQRSSASVPRILILTGGENTTAIEQAVMEKLLRESLEQEGVYVKTVTTAEDFSNNALTGIFNTYVLFEINGMLDTVEAVRSGLSHGHGVVVAGSGERSRAVAEALGFEFGEALSGNVPAITFTNNTGLGLSGTLPVSGTALPPRKRGAQVVAVFPDSRPAVLLDVMDKGRAIVIPFSLTQSALNAGTTSPFGLLLRSAILAVVPGQETAGAVASVQLLVSSPSGPVRTQIVETLPRGSKVVWTSITGPFKNDTLTFDLTAGPEPQKIIYLFQPARPAAAATSSEVFSECKGRLVSQGKVE